MISRRSAPGITPALTNLELAEPRGFFFLQHSSPTLTAVLVDAGFFLKRAVRIYGAQPPEAAARQLHRIALDHLNDVHGRRVARLYRIFVYDASPAEWRGTAKLARREGIDFVLDPMWSTIRPDLYEHIDGLKSVSPMPQGTESDSHT